jgi:hypothetical protein
MSTHSPAIRARRSFVSARITAVVAGALVGAVVWAILAEAMDGLTQPGFGGQASRPLEAVVVVVASLLGGLLGWAALAVVERVLHRDRRTWLDVVSAAFALSLGGPLSGTGVTAGDRLALVFLHVTVAAVVLPLLYRSAGAPEPDKIEPR